MKTTAFDQKDFFEFLQQANRGHLKIYTGPVAGVGKTYRMLEEAHSLKARGADVVLGYVESHGRKKIDDLCIGLELLPRKKFEYKGVFLEEMDLDGIIKHRPQIVIVDEVAHTNLLFVVMENDIKILLSL